MIKGKQQIVQVQHFSLAEIQVQFYIKLNLFFDTFQLNTKKTAYY